MREQSITRRSVLTGLGGAAALSGLPAASAREVLSTPSDPLDEIEIQTDDFNVSHVYAADLYSLAYGNGYVQARNRLFQMEVFRLIGKGESASVLGEGQLASDIQITRDLYTQEERERMWETESSTTREGVKGFVDGINRKIVERAGSGEFPAEFPALGHAPEPWEPEDVIAVVSFQIGVFGVGQLNQLGKAQEFQQLRESLDDEDAFGDIEWLRTKDDAYTTIPEDELVKEGGQTKPESLAAVPENQLRFLEASTGAEIWGIEQDVELPEDVVTGERTGSASWRSSSSARTYSTSTANTPNPDAPSCGPGRRWASSSRRSPTRSASTAPATTVSGWASRGPRPSSSAGPPTSLGR
jgi:acyl-homoserine lactone acylase PvdQ